MTALAPLLEAFFTQRLLEQRQASANTISSYRDTFRLLLRYASQRTGTAPCALDIGELDAPLIGAFLTYLEVERGNSVRTRNARLAAIHSLFAWAALRHPEHSATISRVLAIPAKRYERNVVTYLTPEEAAALLSAADRSTWTGRRDHAMLALTLQTGLRMSELTALTCADVTIRGKGKGSHVHCTGKGRKERSTPLTTETVAVLRVWLAERGQDPSGSLFPTRTGGRLSRDGVEHRINSYATKAARTCPSLASKTVTAHTLRHSAAMRLLESGVDTTTIALWLGHEDPTTTGIYLHADLTLKEKAIAAVAPIGTKPGRYHPPDPLLAFLEAL